MDFSKAFIPLRCNNLVINALYDITFTHDMDGIYFIESVSYNGSFVASLVEKTSSYWWDKVKGYIDIKFFFKDIISARRIYDL